MKLKVSNLGRIKSAELEIKPFTVFIGKNNTNKTWTAYALYGLLRDISTSIGVGVGYRSETARLSVFADYLNRTTSANSSQVLKSMATESEDSISVVVSRDDLLRGLKLPLEVSLKLQGAALARTLAVPEEDLSESFTDLLLPRDEFLQNGTIRRLVITRFPPTGELTVSALGTAEGEPMFRESWRDSTGATNRDQGRATVESWLSRMLVSTKQRVIALPAERKALVAFSPLFLERSMTRDLSAIYNEPTADFINLLRLLWYVRPKLTESAINTASSVLEHQVLGGSVSSSRADKGGATFEYFASDGPKLRMHAVASLVRSLAGLDMILRHLAVPGDVLVIDEPEMNAHPEAQLQLVELFAMLVNAGLEIVVTTHSPYFVDHLNNMMAAGAKSRKAQAKLAGETKLGSADAFLAPDKVAAYLFQEDGEVKDIVDDGIIDVKSFADESDYVANLYSKIASVENGAGEHGLS